MKKKANKPDLPPLPQPITNSNSLLSSQNKTRGGGRDSLSKQGRDEGISSTRTILRNELRELQNTLVVLLKKNTSKQTSYWFENMEIFKIWYLRLCKPTQGLPKEVGILISIDVLGGSAFQRGNIQYSSCRDIWEESSALHCFMFLCEQRVCHYEICFEWLFPVSMYSSKMILVIWLLAMGNCENKR